MVSRITRFLLVFQLFAAGVIAFALNNFYGIGLVTALLIALGVVILARLLITANNFFLSWIYCSETPSQYRLSWHEAVLLFLGEFKATMITSSWTMPFHAFHQYLAERPASLPVLLVHGYGCNSGYWHSMSKALRRAHITHQAVNMEPVFAGIDELVPCVHRAIEALFEQTGQEKIIVIAHSMGGLATRAYLRVHGDRRIAKVITLGTPHRGTGIAKFGRGVNCQQMRWTGNGIDGVASSWLCELAANESPATYRLFTSIYSHHDNIIAPQTSSHLPGARNIEVAKIGHVALALNPMVQKWVIEEVFAVPLDVPNAKPVAQTESTAFQRA